MFMRKMRRISYLVMIGWIMVSCSYKKFKVFRHIKGLWIIEYMTYDGDTIMRWSYYGKNVMKYYYDNTILFKEEIAEIPFRRIEDRDKETSWELIQKGDAFYIKFYTNDKFFKDTLQIRFYIEDGLCKMDLYNNHVYIKISKWTWYRCNFRLD